MGLDVKTLCLGALMDGEASGYDIKKYFECTFSHFFVAGFGSIYPALAKLTHMNMVTCRLVTQDSKPNRKVYALTPQGKEHFIAELSACEPTHKIRSQFLVMMYFARFLPTARRNEVLNQRLTEMQQMIVSIENYEHDLLQTSQQEPNGKRGELPFCAGFGKAVMRAASDYIRNYQIETQATNSKHDH